jgi:Leucine-rich repeat (LRR) protein
LSPSDSRAREGVHAMSTLNGKLPKFGICIWIFIITGCLLCLSGCATRQESKKPTLFTDANLERVVRGILNAPSGEIDEYYLTGITEIDASQRNIINIAGIEKCVNLRKLSLAENKIMDIRPLSNLTYLTELDVAGNPIISIEPLTGLVNMRNLNFGEHQHGISGKAIITSLEPVAAMKKLEYLKLGHQDLRYVDLEPIASLNALVELNLQETNISDVDALSKLTNLEVLWLHSNNLQDISRLKNLAKIKTLNIAANHIEDFSVILNMKMINMIYIDGNPIHDLSTLANALEQGSFCNGSNSFVRLSTTNVDLSDGSSNAMAIESLKKAGVHLEIMN